MRAAALTTCLRQTWAMTLAELLRLLTSPIWAVLLILWTLVCTLFFSRVVDHASRFDLPAGETPVTYFFRASPEMLSLLLVVFIPQLTMEAIAGRRERGRLEHLEAAGLGSGALLLSAFIATCAILSVLLIPPALIHVVLAAQGDADPGRTLGGLGAIMMQAKAIAALGLLASCWAPRRLSASLIALALGLVWWILSVYAFYTELLTDGADATPRWWTAISLQHPIRDFASGLIDLRTVLSFALLTAGLLYLGRLGLLLHRARVARAVGALLVLPLLVALLALSQRSSGSLDITLRSLHSLHPQTSAAVDDLVQRGPVQATVLMTARMQADAVDGAVLSAARSLLQALESRGLGVTTIDPGLQPQAARDLARDLRLGSTDLTRPMLILRAGARNQVLRMSDLARIEDDADGERRLHSLHIEAAVLNALRRLADGHLPQVAWLAGPDHRPLMADGPLERDRAVGAWQRLMASEGFDLHLLDNWSGLDDGPYAAIVIPGPRRDPPPTALAALTRHLERGGGLLLALDGQQRPPLPGLAGLLADHGLEWSDALLATAQGWRGDTPDLQPLIEARAEDDGGPAALAGRDNRDLFLPFSVPLLLGEARDPRRRSDIWLSAPPGAYLVRPDVAAQRLGRARPVLATVSSDDDGGAGRIVLLGSCDALADGSLAVAGNRLLATGIGHWLTRPNQPLLLPPQRAEARRYQLSPGERFRLLWGLGLGLPLLAALVGTLTWWWRQRR